MHFNKQLFLMSVTLTLAVLMLLPSGTAGVKHMGAFFRASGGSKATHFLMSLFFFTVFGFAVYVAVENGKQIKDHEDAKGSH
jgi:preprotein translocase subunit SecG